MEPSVHLCDWPSVDDFPADDSLVAAMDRLRDVASTALRLRENEGLRVRLPLASLTVAGHNANTLEPFCELLADELNVKAVHVTDEIGSLATLVLRPDGKALGPRLGSAVQAVFAAARAGQWQANSDGTVSVADQVLSAQEYELVLESPDGVVAAALRSNDAVVSIDTRRAEDLVVTDRINLWVTAASPAALESLAKHGDYVSEQVLATHISTDPAPEGLRVHKAKVDSEPFRFSLRPTPAEQAKTTD